MTSRNGIALLFATVLAAFMSTGVSAQTTASDHTYATRYDSMGRIVGTISPDPDGTGGNAFLATRTTYDSRNLPVLVETGELSQWKNEYEDPASDWSPDFSLHSAVETTYDVNRRMVQETTRDSTNQIVSLVQYSYDNRGRLECTAVRMNPAAWDSLPVDACTLGPKGPYGPDRITRTYYDAAGQVLQIRKAVGTPDQISDVTYSYTANGKIENVVDANGNRAKYHYDDYDRLSNWSFPNPVAPTNYNPDYGQVWGSGASTPTWTDFEAYQYDANGNRTQLRKRDGSIIKYTYDALNRLTFKDIPDTRPELASYHRGDVYYSYDLRGMQLSARYWSHQTEGIDFTYDGFGRLSSEAQKFLADPTTRTVWSQYDANGNRTRVTHPDASYWTYTYDGLDRLTSVGKWTTPQGTFNYNARGLAQSVAWTDNTLSANRSDYGYDNVGRLNQIALNIHDTSSDVTWDYTRNPASQIKSEGQTNDSYAWDGFVAVNRDYSANGLNQYSTVGGANFCYDANGNLTADGSFVYLYDYENRLVQKRIQTNSDCSSLSYSGSLLVELRYDPTGRLYEVNGGSGGVQRFVYDGNALIAEYNGSGQMLRRYVHGSNVEADDPLIVYERETLSGSHFLTRYLHADPRGSIVAVTDWRGRPYRTNTYDEFGIPDSGTITTGNCVDDVSTKGRFRYTGQLLIPELCMYYYKARIYSFKLGRFMQTDPIGYEDQFNLYAYVGNDPINGIDPTGLMGDKKYEDEPLSERLINQAIGTKEQVDGAIDAADAAADTPGNMAQDAATEAVPDSIYQTDRERQGIDGDYKLYPDYPNLPEVEKVVNSGIVHAIEQGIERGVFEDSAAARGAFSGLKSGITESGAWPSGTVYDRDGGGSIRPNSVLVPVGNGGYAVYRVRSNGTATLRTTLNRR